jgi:hypothetical protein
MVISWYNECDRVVADDGLSQDGCYRHRPVRAVTATRVGTARAAKSDPIF